MVADAVSVSARRRGTIIHHRLAVRTTVTWITVTPVTLGAVFTGAIHTGPTLTGANHVLAVPAGESIPTGTLIVGARLIATVAHNTR